MGISLGGSDEHSGVTIVGKKKLNNRKVLNLVTPFIKFEDEHCPYKFSNDLYDACNEIITEANLYMEGKHAPNPQLALELP